MSQHHIAKVNIDNITCHHRMASLFATLIAVLSGCSSYHYDYAPVDPPEENQWITIRGTLPPNINGFLYAKYRSNVCMRPRAKADGSVGQEGNITKYEIGIQPNPDGSYQGRVYLHGGSRCDWKLYDILFFSEPKSIAPYQKKLPIDWQSITFDYYSAYETVQVIPASAEQLVTGKPLRMEASYYPNFVAAYDPDNLRNLSFRPATSSPNIRRPPTRFIYPTDNRSELGIIDFSPTVDMDYVVYTKYVGTLVDKNLMPNKNYKKETHYPNGDVIINEPDDRAYRYYEKKREKTWGDEILEKFKKQGGGDKYRAICWIATLSSISLFLIGLWNASLLLSEKGFYIMAFLLALFASATMQKNERDQATEEQAARQSLRHNDQEAIQGQA